MPRSLNLRKTLKTHSSAKRRSVSSVGQVRIIGGQWRGRRLPVADVPGLRPTGDRVRETLFNWLQADVAGSHCLDLFAGSGALGFEALSRYAASVTFVEPHSAAFELLGTSAALLKAQQVVRVPGTAEQFLRDNTQKFDLVFIDPPFADATQWSMLTALSAHHLSPSACVYVESPATQAMPAFGSQGYDLHREKQFGDVVARLFRATNVA